MFDLRPVQSEHLLGVILAICRNFADAVAIMIVAYASGLLPLITNHSVLHVPATLKTISVHQILCWSA